ncbi:hypothetical protein [Vitiosangium sp. GDMCC 1.1324]|uniref:hypothetical protein n=1 Tax=Vitiosangium sp. (strain GDMCC 1.1324) TaxID=2138576 RepID=UPI000D335C0C|nr:hypothetical protein [Vitiosangium sp. GDMCC 1.1324]PTL74926.1 hypothetical protein DAT35_57735 [Vitiosangium sp. GDMCC 1.1324]
MNARNRFAAALVPAALGLTVAVGVATPAHAERPGRTFETYKDRVAMHCAFARQWLDVGKSWFFGNSELKMQSDGNLVMYHRWTRQVLWSTNTPGSGATKLRFQKDGNLVLYKADSTPVWASRTDGKCNQFKHSPVLALQADGNLVIYCAELFIVPDPIDDNLKVLWATGTRS